MQLDELQLSQFPRGSELLVLTAKYSKGKMKKVHLGAEVYASIHFSIVVHPLRRIGRFSLRTTRTGGIILSQDPDGELSLDISENISIRTDKNVSTNFLEVETRYGTLKVPVRRIKNE